MTLGICFRMNSNTLKSVRMVESLFYLAVYYGVKTAQYLWKEKNDVTVFLLISYTVYKLTK